MGSIMPNAETLEAYVSKLKSRVRRGLMLPLQLLLALEEWKQHCSNFRSIKKIKKKKERKQKAMSLLFVDIWLENQR